MSEEQVLEVMHQPYSQKVIALGSDEYDVWFYVTRMSGLNQSRMVPQNLTPLIFKNGELAGWGFDYYNYLIGVKEGKIKQVQPEKQRREDVPLEKALDTPRTQAPTQPQQPAAPEKPPAPQQPKAPPQTPPRKKPAPQQGAAPKQPKAQKPPPDQESESNPLAPPGPPIQPEPTQPPEPKQPEPGQHIPLTSQPVSVRTAQSPPEDDDTEETEDKPDNPYADPKSRQMLEEENEQNFNFW